MKFVILIIVMVFASCLREHYRAVDIDMNHCDVNAMNLSPRLKGHYRVYVRDVRKLEKANRDCQAHLWDVAEANKKAAELNRPDGFFEDLVEMLSGVGIGAIIGIIAAL